MSFAALKIIKGLHKPSRNITTGNVCYTYFNNVKVLPNSFFFHIYGHEN